MRSAAIRNLKQAMLLTLLTAHAGILNAQASCQWRGPHRDGIHPHDSLLTRWPDGGPEKLWSVTGIGKGYSSAAVTADAIFVSGMKDSTDYLIKISKEGELLWTAPAGRSWTGTFPDSRSTPTVDGERVYLLSGTGTLSCLDAGDGALKWSLDAAGTFDARWGDWGICESLLLTRDHVIYTPAGPRTTLVALAKESGTTVWESPSLNDTGAYVSPVLMQVGGRELIVTLTARYLVGVDAGDGTILWSYDYASLLPEKSLKVWPGAPFTNTITPLIKGNQIYITGGYDHVGARFELHPDASGITLVWTDTILDTHHGGVVLLDGYIYGSNWINNANGNWCCIGWESGKPGWEENWFTKGSVISDGHMLYFYEERGGHLALVRPDPQKLDVRSSFRITEGTGPHWAHPVIADGILYIRHGDVLMAFSLRTR